MEVEVEVEMERCIIYALKNNYQILYCEDLRLDFVFIKSKRILIHNKNGQLMVNNAIKKIENYNKLQHMKTNSKCAEARKSQKISN